MIHRKDTEFKMIFYSLWKT